MKVECPRPELRTHVLEIYHNIIKPFIITYNIDHKHIQLLKRIHLKRRRQNQRALLLNVLDSFFRDRSPLGGTQLFSGRGVCGPDFRSVGLANWHLPLKRGACERKISKFGGLWAENFQIWGLVSWKFPNLGACELKFGWKLRLFRLKFPNFLKRGSCELTLLMEMGPLRAAGEAWKGGLQGRTSPYPLPRSVPPPPGRSHTLVGEWKISISVHMNFLGELKHPWRHDAQNDSEVRKITHTFSIKKLISLYLTILQTFHSQCM